MLAVLLGGGEPGYRKEMTRLLGRHYDILSSLDGTLIAPVRSPSLLLCEAKDYREINNCDVILLYREWLPVSARFGAFEQVVAVVDSGNDALGEQISATGLPAITCGLYARDTITLSSMDTDRAVIGVQRSISCFDGTRADPQDIPVRLHRPVDPFALMSMAAVLILSGKLEVLLKGKL